VPKRAVTSWFFRNKSRLAEGVVPTISGREGYAFGV
jgi:hypothetical protein